MDYTKIIAWKKAERAKFAAALVKPPKKRAPKPKIQKRHRLKHSKEHFPVYSKADYLRYLKTRHWKTARARAIRKHGSECSVCGVALARPQVHHKHYKTLWHEKPGDLVIMCRAHHESHHLGVTGDELKHLKACYPGK